MRGEYAEYAPPYFDMCLHLHSKWNKHSTRRHPPSPPAAALSRPLANLKHFSWLSLTVQTVQLQAVFPENTSADQWTFYSITGDFKRSPKLGPSVKVLMLEIRRGYEKHSCARFRAVFAVTPLLSSPQIQVARKKPVWGSFQPLQSVKCTVGHNWLTPGGEQHHSSLKNGAGKPLQTNKYLDITLFQLFLYLTTLAAV